jgi:hypothetical protein
MSYQADSTGFAIARQDFTVAADLAEQYGYTDAFEGAQVSALDAIVAAHIAIFGADREIINGKLQMATGEGGDFVVSFMGDGLGNMAFLINGASAPNGAPAQVLAENDIVELDVIHDTVDWSDAISWFEVAGEADGAKTEALTVDAGTAVELTLWRNPAMGWGTPELLGEANIVRVSSLPDGPGAVFSLPLAATDVNGRASITFDLPGTYVLSATDTNEDSTIPLMSPWLEVTVNPAATTGAAPAQAEIDAMADKVAVTLSAALDRSNDYQSEWLVIGLARGDYLSDAQKATYQDALSRTIVPVLAEGGAEGGAEGNGRLSATRATENSRVILALSALGVDATDFDGYDLTAPLADIDYVAQQGVISVAYALQALDSGTYGEQATRDALIAWLTDGQLDSGGWALSGSVADADTTAMVLAALAPHYATGNAVWDDAVEAGVEALASLQGDGGFGTNLSTAPDVDSNSSSGGGSGVDSNSNSGVDSNSDSNSSSGTKLTMTAESCASVVIALASLGIPLNDSRFVQGGENPYSVLSSYFIDNGDGSGAFRHLAEGAADAMATEQAMLALQALQALQAEAF